MVVETESKTLVRGWRLALLVALLGLLALAGVLNALGAAQPAHASPLGATTTLRYQRGYYLDNGWFCYGWANGAYHCTAHWHRNASGQVISDNPAWVPNSGAPAPIAARPGVVGATGPAHSAVNFCSGAVDFSNAAQWAVPHGCYGQIFYPNPANFPSRPSWGWCNWVAEESQLQFGGYNALYQAKHYGAPVAGTIIWYSPFDQGASAEGHWGVLIAIGPNGWGLSEEMNFYYRGGGWGRVDYRFIRLYAPGTAYLY